MAYVPPHKRNSGGYGGFRAVQRNAISKWFIVPSLYTSDDIKDDGDNPLACSVPFTLTEWEYEIDMFILTSIHPPPKDISGDDGQSSAKQIEPIEVLGGVTPTMLVFNYYPASGVERCEIPSGFVKNPWRCIAEEIQQDLVASFQELRTEMFSNKSELISPSFVVRFGTNLLHGVSLSAIRILNFRTALRTLFREHRTDIPDSDVEVILNEVIPKIGVDFTAMKEYYYVKVFDKYRKHANVTCKCNVNKDAGELDLCKARFRLVTSIVTF